MNTNRSVPEIKALIEKYHAAGTSLAEEQTLFAYFGQAEIDPELAPFAAFFRPFSEDFKQLKPSEEMVQKVLASLDAGKQAKPKTKPFWQYNPYFAIAASITALVLAFSLGYLMGERGHMGNSSDKPEVLALKQEMREMKELMVRNFLDQKQTHQKLYALTLAAQLEQLEEGTLEKVFATLNYDANVNIRLAAVEILYPFSHRIQVQENIVDAFSNQESPLVILELVRILKSLDTGTSHQLLQEVMERDDVKDSLKSHIRTTYESI